MRYFLALVTDGALAGAIYALIALAFVVVYKASRTINFALGEWLMIGSLAVAAAMHWLGLGLAAALGAACIAMIGLGLGFNRIVLRRLVVHRLVALIMVTLGLGALMRGIAPIAFRGVPAGVPLPISAAPIDVHGVLVATDRLVAALIASAGVAAITWFFRGTRTGLALRAIADDQQVAMAVGVDVHRHFAIAWGLVGVLAVVSGTLWTFVAGGGFGMALVGLKVFPIVIIGGLDSIPGTIVGAVLVGVVESLAAGYLDPHLGGGFSSVASYLVLILVLFVRPYGLFGRPDVERI